MPIHPETGRPMAKPQHSLQLFVLVCIEHDSFSGAKPDGYYGFLDHESAKAFVADKYKDRDPKGPTPSYYANYEEVGLKPARSDLVSCLIDLVKTKTRNHICFDKLSQLE